MCFARNFGTLPYNEVADIRCLMSGDSYYSSNYLQSNRHDTSKKQTDDNPHAARQCVKDERFCAATRPGGGRGEGLAPVKVPIYSSRAPPQVRQRPFTVCRRRESTQLAALATSCVVMGVPYCSHTCTVVYGHVHSALHWTQTALHCGTNRPTITIMQHGNRYWRRRRAARKANARQCWRPYSATN